jgi:hypothetical protein
MADAVLGEQMPGPTAGAYFLKPAVETTII